MKALTHVISDFERKGMLEYATMLMNVEDIVLFKTETHTNKSQIEDRKNRREHFQFLYYKDTLAL